MAALSPHNCSPNPLYVLLKGGNYLTVRGANSRHQVDVDMYDGTTYRRIVDAAMLGNAHIQVVTQEHTKAVDVGYGFATANDGAVVALAGPTTAVTPTEVTDSAFQVDTSDLLPGNVLKTRSLIQWWTSTVAAGGGTLVAEVWADQIRGWSSDPPENLA